MNWQEHSINNIKDYLSKIDVTEDVIAELEQDYRQGVKNLAKKYKKILKKEINRKKMWIQLNKKQIILNNEGYKLVAGIDEAGRGPLAGPVVAAVVILDPQKEIFGLNDSKKLSEQERERLFAIIQKKSFAFATGIIDNNIIDQINILQATYLAMKEAIAGLNCLPDFILVDGNNKIPNIDIEQEAIVDGDSKVNAIAAASIIAKVTRDRILLKYDSTYPQYGFSKHKGYGTREHIQALQKHGPSPLHRFSFSIVNQCKFNLFKDKLLRSKTKNELNQIAEDITKYSFFTQKNLKELRKLYKEKFIKVLNNV